jgi:hypothetical protein
LRDSCSINSLSDKSSVVLLRKKSMGRTRSNDEDGVDGGAKLKARLDGTAKRPATAMAENLMVE